MSENRLWRIGGILDTVEWSSPPVQLKLVRPEEPREVVVYRGDLVTFYVTPYVAVPIDVTRQEDVEGNALTTRRGRP